jgi:integrase
MQPWPQAHRLRSAGFRAAYRADSLVETLRAARCRTARDARIDLAQFLQDVGYLLVIIGEGAIPRCFGGAGEAADLGFKAHPHMLRHACGFALAKAGIVPSHSNCVMTAAARLWG